MLSHPVRALVGGSLVGCLLLGVDANASTTPTAAGLSSTGPSSSLPSSDARAAAIPWLSGASGSGVADGTFGSWRGRRVAVAGIWHDVSAGAMMGQWSLSDQGPLADWQGGVDNAIGAFDAGETWAAAASGAYDERWITALQTMRANRQGDTGKMFIRFAHEFNGNWYPWTVKPGMESDFVTAWRRFADLRDQYYPKALLVWSPNADTTSGIHTTHDAWPGREYVDVVGVDSYNWWPHYPSEEDSFDDLINNYSWRAPDLPHGLQTWLDFAASQGLPMAVPEWSNRATEPHGGESPEFMTEFHAWLVENGGRNEPGKVWYEALFNVGGYDGNQYQLWPKTDQPVTAQAYRDLW